MLGERSSRYMHDQFLFEISLKTLKQSPTECNVLLMILIGFTKGEKNYRTFKRLPINSVLNRGI
jgi:hypothetical protein